MGQYLSLQKFPEQKNLPWKNFQNIVTHLFLICLLVWNLIRQGGVSSFLIAIVAVLTVFIMTTTKYYRKLMAIRQLQSRIDSPLCSIVQVNSILIQTKQKEDIQNKFIPIARNQKWDQLINKGLDNWYLTLSFKKETKIIDIEQMNSPMEIYLGEKQLSGLELLNRIKTFHLSNANNYSASSQVQIEHDQTLYSILVQWFEEDIALNNVEKKQKKLKSFREIEDPLLSPHGSQRDHQQANSKLFRLNTLQSKKTEKNFTKEPPYKYNYEKQPSLISQINNVPDSRVKLDQSYQSFFAKSDLSLLLTKKQKKNKSYIPCVLTLEDNQQLYLSVSIITFNYDQSSQEFQTAVIIENNHHQVLQNLQLINLQARLNIIHNFVSRQSQENQTFLKTLIEEKQILIQQQQIFCAYSPDKITLAGTCELKLDNLVNKDLPINSTLAINQIPSGFSFCADHNQNDSMKEMKDMKEMRDSHKIQQRDSALSFQMNKDKLTQNTLSIPTQVKIIRQSQEFECETPQILIQEQSVNNAQSYPPDLIIKCYENQLQLIQSLICKGFKIVNNSYNYMDFFGDNQSPQTQIQKNFKLDQVITNILNMLQFHENVKKYQIKLILDSRLKYVIMSTDRRKVKQVFTNLIMNAIEGIQTSQANNQIIIELADDAKVKPKSQMSQIYVTITDTGEGLTQEHLENQSIKINIILKGILDARFGLLSVENTLNQLGPGASYFNIRNLRCKDDITASGCQAFFKLNRNGNFKQKNYYDEQSLFGFKLDESQFIEK